MQSKIIIASRQSDLARLQAESVAARIQEKFPDIKIELNFRASLGDQNQNDPLWKMPEKGVFTEDFYLDLVNEKVDLVVHSWKDLPLEKKPDTEIVATLERADQRDLFLLRKSHLGKENLKILTSSPRRGHNLADFFKNYLPYDVKTTEFVPVRGNIPTRLRKLMQGESDGLIVAKAALDRLLSSRDPQYADVQKEIRETLRGCHWMCLPLTDNPTAAAQGALAMEIKKGSAVAEILAAINHPDEFAAVEKEREILGYYGGGCHQKIGVSVLRRPFGEVVFLRGITDKGVVLDSIAAQTHSAGSSPATPARALQNIWPAPDERVQLFERTQVPIDTKRLESSHLWVAKEEAWPEGLKPGADQVVWCAGLKTWRKLARRGVWVHGSSESLGESENPRLGVLLKDNDLKWTKLTHREGVREPRMEFCATYELVPRAVELDLQNKTHFFWSSGSTFDHVVSLYPEILSAQHGVGPGHSYEHIKKRLPPKHSLTIYLSYQDWFNRVLRK